MAENDAWFGPGGFGASPGPMTLASSLFSDTDPDSDCRTLSQLLAGAMVSPPAGEGSSSGADFRFEQNRPPGLAVTQSQMSTIPPGISPASLLESPCEFPAQILGMARQYHLDERVEVVGAENGLLGSYRTARITLVSPMVGFYRVEYETLMLDDMSACLVEDIPYGLLRPVPPYRDVINFEIGQHVDVWAQDGWWYGTILRRPDFGMYEVDFSAFNYDDVVVSGADLRVHLHWNGQVWVCPNSTVIQQD